MRAALSAERAFEIVDLMAASPDQAFTLSELVRRTGVNVASCHAILNVLLRRGHLARDPVRKAYRLAPAMAAIGAATELGDPLLAAARAAVAHLASHTGLEALLTARAGNDIIGLARAASPRLPRVSLRVGQRVPLTPPYGGVFMAWAAHDDAQSWAEHGDAGRVALHLAALERVRVRGYQVTLRSPVQDELTRAFASAPDGGADPERLEALFASLGPELYQPEALEAERSYEVEIIAAPIFDAHRRVAFAMSLYADRGALSGVQVLRLASELTRLCLDVTREHGGAVPLRTTASTGRRAVG